MSGVNDLAAVMGYATAMITGVGSVVGVYITVRSRRNESKWTAADMMTESTERYAKLNLDLDTKNVVQRECLLDAARVMDRFLSGEATRDDLETMSQRIHIRYG